MSTDAYALPTSFAQQRLWFLDRLVPDSPFYNIHVALPLRFAVDPVILAQVLDALVERHETLRTTFIVADGVPMQVVADRRLQAMPHVDLSALPRPQALERARARAEEDAKATFDLERGPLLRTTLLTLGAEEHVLLVTLHHIITDAWSMGVLLRELAALYEAFFLRRPSPLPELPLQYADYAEWQREWLAGPVLEEQLAYWRERLADSPPLGLPTDHPRPPVPSFSGATHRFRIAAPLVSGIHRLARAQGVTPFMVLLASFYVLLYRYSGQTDIVVGVPIANREHEDLEALIGFFVNTLVLRQDLGGRPTFSELLARVRDTTVGAYAHQDLPFEKLVEELNPERDLSRNPLFQVSFQLHNEPGLAGPTDAAAPSPVPSGERGTANFDLVFDLWEGDEGLLASIDYATDLFEPDSITRLARHYRQLLTEIVRDPDRDIELIPLLTADERTLVLQDWNATMVPYPRDGTVHAEFAKQVARSPDAVAVELQGTCLRYRELDLLSNRVAHGLRERGVGPGCAVGICTPRSLELIVGLLGILKAGAAYVGFEPAEPAARRATMLRDAAIAVVLTTRATKASLAGSPVQLACLDLDDGDFVDASPGSILPAGGPEDLVYIAFTSGSTGTPKGVCVVHRAVLRLVCGCRFIELGPRNAVLHLSPVAFDASTLEIWGPLLNGGRVVVHPPEAPTLAELGRTLRESGVDTAWLTAGLFHQMVDHELESVASVRQLLAGGDVLSPDHVRRLLAQPGERVLVNGYGPTENTTFTCCHRMHAPQDVGHGVSIGRPIANTRIYILDAHMSPVPIGVPGELWIGGDGLSVGYLGRPDETAERFVSSPLDPGGILYRTGDRARFRPDGNVEFLGRMDRQLKVRGFRIEPGELESALQAHPEVRQTVVVPHTDAHGLKQLRAIVETDHDGPSPAALLTYLRERVPHFMIPSEIVRVDQLPLNANGKVDLRRVPGPGAGPSSKLRVPPRSDVEEVLAALWREILGCEEVGVLDNFFSDHGGHSLLATLLSCRLRETFDLEVPLRMLFERPDIAGQALAIEEAVLTRIEALTEDDALLLVDEAVGVRP
jgi:amino acid adenylation domain-containing protein